jgi:predicted nucleic acid-binding protein
MKNWYKNLEYRFSEFPSHVQILNIVSDLKKAEHFLSTNRSTAVNHLYRAIILIDYVVDDPKWKNKLREVLRLREVIASLISQKNPYATLSMTIDTTIQLNPKAYKMIKSIQ